MRYSTALLPALLAGAHLPAFAMGSGLVPAVNALIDDVGSHPLTAFYAILILSISFQSPSLPLGGARVASPPPHYRTGHVGLEAMPSVASGLSASAPPSNTPGASPSPSSAAAPSHPPNVNQIHEANPATHNGASSSSSVPSPPSSSSSFPPIQPNAPNVVQTSSSQTAAKPSVPVAAPAPPHPSTASSPPARAAPHPAASPARAASSSSHLPPPMAAHPHVVSPTHATSTGTGSAALALVTHTTHASSASGNLSGALNPAASGKNKNAAAVGVDGNFKVTAVVGAVFAAAGVLVGFAL
ncbi:hypothetical protein LXA43DRAFT_1121633 [Ganoderma leucocontextum]|nr:hypothetical protein LXA43DRAFT_1121633 [Ganoderma leucocontextum]